MHIGDLQAEVTALRAEFEVLACALTSAAEGLSSQGRVPDDALVRSIKQIRARYSKLRDNVLAAAYEYQLRADTTASLLALGELVEQLSSRAHAARLRNQALALLDRLERLDARHPAAANALAECNALARATRDEIERTWPAAQDAVESLATGKHPLAILLLLVEGGDQLSNDAWAELHVRVAQGVSANVAHSAARGYFRITEAPANAIVDARLMPSAPSFPAPEPVVVTMPMDGLSPVIESLSPSTTAPIQNQIVTPNAIETQSVEGIEQTEQEEFKPQSPSEPAPITLLPGQGPVSFPVYVATVSLNAPRFEEKNEPLILAAAPEDHAPATALALEEPTPIASSTSTDEPESLPVPVHASENHNAFVDLARQLGTLAARLDQDDRNARNGQAAERTPIAPRLPLATEKTTHIDAPGSTTPLWKLADRYTFSSDPNWTASQIAVECAKARKETRSKLLMDLGFALLREKKASLAYHLARYAESAEPAMPAGLPLPLLRLMILCSHVTSPLSTATNLISLDLIRFSEEWITCKRGDWSLGMGLLAIGTLLRPALLAPQCGATDLLTSLALNEGTPSDIGDLCRLLAEVAPAGLPVNPSTLRQLRDRSLWEQEMATLRSSTQEWWNKAKVKSLVFPAVTQAWRRCMEPSQPLHALVQPILDNDPSALEATEHLVHKYSDPGNAKRLLEETDRNARGFSSLIDGKALKRFCDGFKEPVDKARRWVELQSCVSDEGTGPHEVLLEKLRQFTVERRANLLKALTRLEESAGPITRIGVEHCRNALEDFCMLLDPDHAPNDQEIPAHHLLHGDLLLIPEIELDGEWSPMDTCTAEASMNVMIGAIAAGLPAWRAVFDRHCKQRNHDASARVIALLESKQLMASELPAWRESRERHLAEARAALQSNILRTDEALDRAVALGLVTEAERNENAAKIKAIEFTQDEILAFEKPEGDLKLLRRDVAARKKKAVEDIGQRLNKLANLDKKTRERIDSAIKTDELLTANEYIDMVSRGEPLPLDREPRSDVFRAFMGIFAELERHLKGVDRLLDANKVINNLMARLSQTMNVAPNAKVSCEAMLEAWFLQKLERPYGDQSLLRQLTQHLGFDDVSVKSLKRDGRQWLDVTTRPLEDRERCPVPEYGSSANGRYRLIYYIDRLGRHPITRDEDDGVTGVDRPSEDRIVADAEEISRGISVIAFCFGRLDMTRRRNLARLCREKRQSVLVVDDILLLYLAASAGPRLPMLFQCALPFTHLEPYKLTAGLLRPEMFYGRRDEHKVIAAPEGPCMIYGGRQLGKTVLLHDIQRAFHHPEEGHIALWFDIEEEIYVGQKSGDIWKLIADGLAESGVQVGTYEGNPQDFLRRIQKWLHEDKQRRILILFDESDRFLGIDALEHFQRVVLLKGLMDRTERRFKVVFAGLHNVQRTSRQQNNPLAHFQDPVCIGPLLDHGEPLKARELIETPLGSLGYRFESADLVMRILSQTNYYPNLIQLYCAHLLRYMNEPGRGIADAAPPYVIKAKHVDEVYQRQELRDAIRERFGRTLELDQRYEVIAYAIAFHTHSDSGIVDGYSVEFIRDAALSYWKEGFRESSSLDAIRDLLEEMIGLGILRVTRPAHYTLRGPNVFLLLGTEDELLVKLTRPREPQPTQQPGAFRTAYRASTGIDKVRRNPLTVAQESDLRRRGEGDSGVAVVFGCEAAGLGELEPFFEADATGRHEEQFLKATTLDAIGKIIAGALDTNDRRRALVFVPFEANWSYEWLRYAVEELKRVGETGATIRVVLEASPTVAWNILRANPMLFDDLASLKVKCVSLSPWNEHALRQWLDDCNFGLDMRRRIEKETGCWPLLLRAFYEGCQNNPKRWERVLECLTRAIEHQGLQSRLTNAFGLDVADPRQVLLVMAQLGQDVCAQDLFSLVDGTSLRDIQTAIHWAERLNLIHAISADRFRLNETVARIVLNLS